MSLGQAFLRRFRAHSDPTGLGKLERRVMDIFWGAETPLASVREIQALLPTGLAYTTVMTTLDRLHRKGLLARSRDGRAYRYRAELTREELEQGLARALLSALLGVASARAEPILSSIVDVVSERDRELLDELERLVRARKRQDRERG